MEPDLSDAESTNVSDTKDEDIVSRHESEEEEPSDSESREGSTSSPQTSPRAGRDSPGSRRNRTNRISYSDFSYLNALSRQERRRIEDEMIKGRKLGECNAPINVKPHYPPCGQCRGICRGISPENSPRGYGISNQDIP